MSDLEEFSRLHREMDELFDRMNARFDRIDKMLTECSAAINVLIERNKAQAEHEPRDDQWERAAALRERLS